jgi:hypothetical protein
VGDRPPGEWRRIGHRRESYAAPNGKSTRRRQKLLQLRVLGLGLLQNWDVGVGVFPEREEILPGMAGSPWLLRGRATVAQQDHVGDHVKASDG